MNKKFNNKVLFVLIVFLLLALTKIDFRFDEINPGSFVDDAEYYYHAQTIAIDRDLDYSNQMPDTPYRNLNVEDRDKVLPVHSIGVGIFAAPFLFIANMLSSIFSLDSLISFNYFIYSFIPVFYLYVSFILLKKILKKNSIKVNNLFLLCLIGGSGVSYFAFERFSMSHAYEFFGTTLCLYISNQIIYSKNKNTKNTLLFFLPVMIFIVLTIRWSNYFLILIPLFVKQFIKKDVKLFYLEPFFLTGFLVGLSLFLLHTKILHGIYTLNPSDIFFVVENRYSSDYYRFFDQTRIVENILFIFKTFFIINFSQEFGLMFFSPILFFGSSLLFIYLVKKDFLKLFIIAGIIFFPFFSTLVLNNPGYSYGYRYYYSTIPMFILVYFLDFSNNKTILRYLFYFSVLGIVFQLFFESSPYVVLSTENLTNSFGLYTNYVNPTILSGMFKSFLIIDSYLNIIFTSFIGVFIIKVLSLFMSPLDLISNFREPDEKIIELVEMSISFSWVMFFLVLLTYLGIARNFINKD